MSLDNLIKKKGNYSILKLLKYKARYYNSIKKHIVEKISARTLDFRLKELTQAGLLKTEIFEKPGPLRKKYSLTKKGMIFLTCLEALDPLIADKIKPEEFQNKLQILLNNMEIVNFENVWSELKDILSKEDILYTLKKKRQNKIREIDDSGILIETNKGVDKIAIKKIKNAWLNLVEKGELLHSDYEASTYRSSFILTLFSQLPYVKINEGPPLSISLELSK